MRVLLAKPLLPSQRRIYVVPPFNMGYLARSIMADHEVHFADAELEAWNVHDWQAHLKQVKPDVIGINFFSHNFQMVKQTLKATREILPQATILVGGPHSTAMKHRILNDLPEADYAWNAEAEIGLPLFLKELEKPPKERYFEEIPGLIWRDAGVGSNRVNPNYFHENIDDFDYVPWDLIQLDKYFKGLPQGFFQKRHPLASMITTRGCPYPCVFCSASQNAGRKIRTRSAEHVMKEIEHLYRDWGVREIHILDDNFTFNRSHVMNICNQIIQSDMEIAFTMPNGIRLDTLDDELLETMVKAGWYAVGCGIETGSERLLKYIHKATTLDKIRKNIKMVKRHRLQVTGFFIIGLPTETEAEIRQTERFAWELDLDLASFGNYTPMPGTPAWKEQIKSGEITEDFRTPFTWGEVIYAPQGMTKERLAQLQRRIVLKFYFHPKRFLLVLKNLRARNITHIFRRLWLLLFHT